MHSIRGRILAGYGAFVLLLLLALASTLWITQVVQLRLLLGMILVATLGAVGGVSWLTLRAIASPIAFLASRAAAIGRGELTGVITAQGTAEISALGDRMESLRLQLVEDTAQRQRYEQHLARYAAIVRSIHEAVITADPDGVITGWNPGAEQVYGYAAAEIIGQHLSVLEPDYLEGETRLHLRLVRDGHCLTDIEGERLNKSGEAVVVSITLSPLRDDDGRIIGVASLSRDIEQRKEAEEQTRSGALRDPCTGLPNAALLDDRLEQALMRAGRTGEGVAVLVMQTSGAQGHAEGDEDTRPTTAQLLATLRASDTVARLEGERFAIVLPDTSVQQAQHTSQRILQALHQSAAEGEDAPAPDASVGIAVFPDHGRRPDALLRHAELAMNVARHMRQGAWIYAPDHDLSSPLHLARISELRTAIEQTTLDVYFQPIVNLDSGQVVRVEALARWRPTGEDFVPPSQFLHLAEEAGLIQALDMMTLQRALADAGAWRANGLHLPVGVNLSAVSLRDPNLSDTILSALHSAGAEASSLVIEAKQSAFGAERESVIASLQALRRLGVRVAIDDAGNRSSSLSHLRHLPLDEIKIDRSFIQHLASSEREVVMAAVSAGQSLGCTTSAVGIEDEETLHILRSLHCTTGQGYILGRPMPAGALLAWIQASEQQSLRAGRPWSRQLQLLDFEILRRLRAYPSDVSWDDLFAAFGAGPARRADLRRAVERLADQEWRLIEADEQRVGLTLAGRFAADQLGAGLTARATAQAESMDAADTDETGSGVVAL